MKYRKWYKITIHINDRYQDLLIGQLTALQFNGFSQENKLINCFIPAVYWTKANKIKFKSIIGRFKSDLPVFNDSYSMRLINDKNWNKSWEKQTGMIEATPNIIIKPSWIKLPHRYKNRQVLHVDPKMSFGTGHHETTRLSLAMLERYLRPNMKVLDLGCGTGVLGIAAIKLGAHSVIAIDIDDWAIRNANENMKRNRINSKMKIRLGSINVVKQRKFDLIIANIDIMTISLLFRKIISKIQKQGVIILSGILTNDMYTLIPLVKDYSLVPLEVDIENEWSAIALLKV